MQIFMVYLLLIASVSCFENSSSPLQQSMKEEIVCDRSKKRLLIQKDFVKFSSFTKDYGELKCDFEVQSVVIFATSEFTVDQDFNAATSGLEMFVMAPTWKIIDSRKINLNGRQHKIPELFNKSATSLRGRDGEPGKPGNPGGNFIGIGYEFVNGKNLTITVNGGDGGKGQDGGEGGDGINGVDGELEIVIGHNHKCDDTCIKHIVSSRNKTNCHLFKDPCQRKKRGIFGTEVSCSLKFYCKSGLGSGDGGDGGEGGRPGSPGHILLTELAAASGFIKENNPGKHGVDGKGGKSGKAGRNGINISQEIRWEHKLKHYGTTLQNGINGTDGKKKTETAISSKKINLSETARLVVDYKRYFRENVNVSDSEDYRVIFYNEVESNKKILMMFDTLAFVKELSYLEEDCHKKHKEQAFLPLYQTLLRRIDEYAKQPECPTRSSEEQRKVLTYLYTTVLGREYNLKDRSETALIVDVSGYLQDVQKSMQENKRAKKLQLIQNYANRYLGSVDSKIKEANGYIDKVIIPEIKKIVSENSENVNQLINEILQLEDKVADNILDIQIKKQELKNSLLKSLVCEFFEYVGDVIGAIPRFGEALKEEFQGQVEVRRDGLGLSDEIEAKGTIIPDEITNAPNAMNEIKIKQIAELKDMLELEVKILQQEDPKKFAGLIKQFENIKSTLNEKMSFGELYERRDTLNQLVENSGGGLSDRQRNETNTLSSRFLGINVQYLDKEDNENYSLALAVPLVGSRFLKAKFEHEKKLKILTDVIKKDVETFKNLKSYKESVTKDLSPALENMFNSFLDSAKNLNSKSQAALHVKQWQIQSTLKSMSVAMRKMTKNLNSSESLTNTFTKFADAFNILVKLFDDIQSYQDQRNWANYIADINSAGANRIAVSDRELNEALNNLEVTLSCNVIVQQYKSAVDAFKQYVFPLASVYFRELDLPEYLDYGENVTDVVLEAETQISFILSKMSTYLNTAENAYVGLGEFNSKYSNVEPFFVWKNSKNREVISNLFSGHEVTLYADIRQSDPRFDAIKFSEFQINLKASNDEAQAELDQVLQDCELSATHLGNSYYRSDGKYYLISTSSLGFWYSLRQNEKGMPLRRSVTFDNIKTGDSMLSPYASWILQLRCYPEGKLSQDKLQQYKNSTDIELVGIGRFLDNEKISIDTETDKYYKPVDIEIFNNFKSDEKSQPEHKTMTAQYKFPGKETSFSSSDIVN